MGVNNEGKFATQIAIIEQTRDRAALTVNHDLIDMYWRVGQTVSQLIADGTWAPTIVEEFAEYVQRRYLFARGFSASNIWRMCQMFETYHGKPVLALLVRETTWANNLLIMAGTSSDEAREYYLRLSARDQLGKRELERLIDSMAFEREKMSDRGKVVTRYPRFSPLRDSYAREFLGLPDANEQSGFRRAIISGLRDFILESGPDFAFVGQEYRLQVGGTDFIIDLLFFHRELNCLVAFEIKQGRFKPEYVSQMDFYLEALDRNVKKVRENPSLGLILCSSKDDIVVEYSMSRSLSKSHIAQYQQYLPDKQLLQSKLAELHDIGNPPLDA